jgi:hypothetical protein
VHPVVGPVIDNAEKARFGLFPYYAADDFVDARFSRALRADSAITLRTRLRNGMEVARPFSEAEFVAVRDAIAQRQQELGTAPANKPTAQEGTSEFVGRTYSVELNSGTTFIGVLQLSTPTDLEFVTKDLGLVRVQRTNVKQMVMLSLSQAAKGYDDVGNGNRLFFGPTARNLRKGEGTVQDIYVFFLGVNYGFTDYFSMGALFSWVPAAGTDNFFALTPKLSFPIKENLRAGAGALVFFQKGEMINLTYANTTYGSADNNFTAGVGYSFGRDEDLNTPVFMLGGMSRLTRRISIMNETYILRISDPYFSATLIGGIAGVRVASPRISGSLALLYAGYSNERSGGFGDRSDGTAIPFAEVTFRFGKIK